MTEESKQRWLLSKTNPKATPKSTAFAALMGGCAGTFFWLLLWALSDVPAWPVIPMAAFFAFFYATLEWQCDDSEDEPPP